MNWNILVTLGIKSNKDLISIGDRTLNSQKISNIIKISMNIDITISKAKY